MHNKKTDKEKIQMCKNFKLLREKKGLSIKELSKASGVSEYMIINFEKGVITERASVTHIAKLCWVFEVPVHKNFSPLEP